MAIENFKAVVLEEALILAHKEISIAEEFCAIPSKVEGKTARFNVLEAGQIKYYEGNVEADQVETTAIDLVYDKKKYYAVKVDDADACMLAGDVLVPMANSLAHQLKKAVETEVLAEAVNAGVAQQGAGQLYEDIVDAGVKLDENNCPAGERYVIMRPADVARLVKDERMIAYYGGRVLENGIVEGAEIDGMKIVKSNACPEGKVIVMHKGAVGMGIVLEKTEAMRGEHAFEDIIRGLCVFGVKALRPKDIVVIGQAE